jgi:branched-chain amino acid transport system permease protein
VVQAGVFILLASSFNLIIGHAGLASIAHPIFYATGAYTSALLALHAAWPVWLAIPTGALAAALLSLALSVPALRVSGDYLMVSSIGFQLGLLQVIKNLEITGGQGGLSNIPRAIDGPAGAPLFALLAIGSALVAVLLQQRLMRGAFGRAVAALRDDELAFAALGRDPRRMKLVLFALGSGLAGLAGGLYAFYFQYLSPDQFEILFSGALLTMVVVGGLGSTWGPVFGAVVLTALPQLITFWRLPPAIMAPLQGIVYSALVITFLFWRPFGLIRAEAPR